jgi:hypothetical protein
MSSNNGSVSAGRPTTNCTIKVHDIELVRAWFLKTFEGAGLPQGFHQLPVLEMLRTVQERVVPTVAFCDEHYAQGLAEGVQECPLCLMERVR